MKTMHLFAGAGGGLLADLILGHEPIIAVEWDGYACQVLRERAADGWFPELRVWEGDIRMFDPSEYKGIVSCIHAGFPCQDISAAGKQAGVGEETRSGLYREVIRIAGVVRPKYLFLENVAAIVTNGLDTVIADITKIGYDAEWLCLRASDCGAAHHRDRWWCLCTRREEFSSHSEYGRDRWGQQLSEGFKEKDGDMADTNGEHGVRRGEPQLTPSGEGQAWHQSERGGGKVSNSISPRQPRQVESIQSCNPAKIGYGETTDAFDGGFPGFWTTEPSVGRVANGVANRVHRLKALGNGQVPLQAAVAWKLLGGE